MKLTNGQRFQLVAVRWRMDGLSMDIVNSRYQQYMVALQQAWHVELLELWEQIASTEVVNPHSLHDCHFLLKHLAHKEGQTHGNNSQ